MLEYAWCAIPVNTVGCVNFRKEHKTLCINDKVPLAPIDLFATVKPTFRAANIRCFDRLAVNNCCTWLYTPANRFSHKTTQEVVYLLPKPDEPPQTKRVIHGFPVWKVVRQPFPTAARFGHREHCIKQSTARNRRSPSVGFGFGNAWANDRPFCISDIALV